MGPTITTLRCDVISKGHPDKQLGPSVGNASRSYRPKKPLARVRGALAKTNYGSTQILVAARSLHRESSRSGRCSTFCFQRDFPNYCSRADDSSHLCIRIYSKGRLNLARTGKPKEAVAQYETALETAKVSYSLEHADLPALYAAADPYEGQAEIAAEQARSAPLPIRSKFLGDACSLYKKSLGIWKQIPYPSRLSGNGDLAVELNEVTRCVEACEAEMNSQTSTANSANFPQVPEAKHTK